MANLCRNNNTKMKITKQIIIAILLLIPCITWGKPLTTKPCNTMPMEVGFKRKLETSKMNTPVTPTDSTVLSAAECTFAGH